MVNPIPAWGERIWDSWGIQALLLWSLSLQITLVILGSRRRYTRNSWIRIIVWTAYLMADWVAAVALGKLSDMNNKGDNKSTNPNTALTALWAPLLLIHLGGPDTITAYSMEDNQLWRRHLLGLAVEAAVAVYAIMMCWTNSWLSFLTLPLFLAGIIKYGERIWALWSSVNGNSHVISLNNDDNAYCSIIEIPSVKNLRKAYLSFERFHPHIANSGFKYTRGGYPLVERYAWNADIVQVIEFELGFLYNMLYTKAPLLLTSAGLILRSISFCCVQFSLWGTIIAQPVSKNADVIVVTYVLLVGAVVLDIYSVALLLYSDLGMLWLIKHHKKPLITRVLRFLAPKALNNWRSWSNSMGQFNLLNFCLNNSPSSILGKNLDFFGSKEEEKTFSRILKLFGLDRKHLFMTHVDANVKLKMDILCRVSEWEIKKIAAPTLFIPQILREEQIEQFSLSKDLEIDRGIILWHIATDICYYCDDHDTDLEHKQMSKKLSDYMMYVLVMRPEMLSFTTGDLLCEHASKNIKTILKQRTTPIRDVKEACKKLLRLMSDEGDASSLLPLSNASGTMKWFAPKEAQQLARILMNKEKKWELIFNMWIEILSSAAIHCQLYNHAQQLRRGGEFITLAWIVLTQMEFVA